MNLDLSQRQKQLSEEVKTFAADRVRALAGQIDSGGDELSELLAAVTGRGWIDTTDPDLTDACLVLEALARESASVATAAGVQLLSVLAPLARWQGADAVPSKLGQGRQLGACALGWAADGSASDGWTPTGLSVTYEEVDSGFRLSGRVADVPCLTLAELLLVPARDRDGEVAMLFVVGKGEPGLSVVPRGDAVGVAGIGRGDLELEGVRVAAGARVVDSGQEPDWLERLSSLASLAAAAIAVGVGQAGFEAALATLMSRSDGPETSPQSFQFYVADVSTEVDAARLLTWRSAWALQHRRRAGLEASQAKLFATEAGQKATDLALQVAGADGFRRGSDIERQFRDARSLEIVHGTRENHKRAIADRIVDE